MDDELAYICGYGEPREARQWPSVEGAAIEFHYLAPIEGMSARVLRVVMNEIPTPPIVVTAFFDRRARGKFQ